MFFPGYDAAMTVTSNMMGVISNGYESRFTAKTQRDAGKSAPVPFHIVASGRLTNEKNHVALIHAIARCRHAQDIELTIAGTGP